MVKIKNLKRLKEVVHILTKYGFGYLADSLKLPKVIFRKKAVEKLTRAERIRLIFEELGTTFIKFGQILSTRPDIIPKDVITELKKLQDQVPPFSFKEVEIEFKAEFKKPIKKYFKEFEKIPLASASVGQVHFAKLHTGKKVVVKVQRPNLEGKTSEDIGLLSFFAVLLEKHVPESRLYDPIGLVGEFKKSIKREINFETEAHNLEKFRQLFKNDENICFPEVYWEYTNEKFLTMEYVKGIKVDEFEKLDRKKYNRKLLAKRGTGAIFKQILEYGFFHADPHSGNILILPNDRICFLDCGMVGYLDEGLMNFLANILVSVIERKEKRLISTLMDGEWIPDTCNLHELRLDISEVFINYYDLPLKQIDIGKFLNQIIDIVAKHRIHIPSHFLFVIKALGTIEGVGRQIDPDFNPIEEIKPFVNELLWRQYNPKKLTLDFAEVLKESFFLLKSLPSDARYLIKKLIKGETKIKFEHKGLESLIDALDRTSNRFSFSVIMAAFLISSAIIIHANIPPFLWDLPILGVVGFALAGIVGFVLLISIIRNHNE